MFSKSCTLEKNPFIHIKFFNCQSLKPIRRTGIPKFQEKTAKQKTASKNYTFSLFNVSLSLSTWTISVVGKSASRWAAAPFHNRRLTTSLPLLVVDCSCLLRWTETNITMSIMSLEQGWSWKIVKCTGYFKFLTSALALAKHLFASGRLPLFPAKLNSRQIFSTFGFGQKMCFNISLSATHSSRRIVSWISVAGSNPF